MTLSSKENLPNTTEIEQAESPETTLDSVVHLPSTPLPESLEGGDMTVRLPKLSKAQRALLQALAEGLAEEIKPVPAPEETVNSSSLSTIEELPGAGDATVRLPKLSKAQLSLILRMTGVFQEKETGANLALDRREVSENGIPKPRSLQHLIRPGRRLWPRDSWLSITILCSYIASIASFWYFFQTHQIVLYGDTYAHMLITRRVFDNATPGLAQLGGVWLPLPHLVMIPFIWNDYLWRSGLAGTIPSMICYLIATVYIFLAARRLTKDSRASFVGTLLFILNPNVLYLQTTALSEIVLIATLTSATYYFLVWAQDDKLSSLVLTAAATFLATLARYDGWSLFLAFLVLIGLIGWLKHQSRAQIEANLIVFGILGGLGITLWLAWCQIIFGDPLYFQRGPFSSQAQQRSLIDAHVLFTYHNLWQSIRYYTIDSMVNVGPILFILGVISVLVFIWRRRLSAEMLAGAIFLVPFAFYVVSLYLGQAALYVPGAVPQDFENQIYNARYGVEVVAPAALFLATLASDFSLIRFYSLKHLKYGFVRIQQFWQNTPSRSENRFHRLRRLLLVKINFTVRSSPSGSRLKLLKRLLFIRATIPVQSISEPPKGRFRLLGQLVLGGVIIVQTWFIVSGGIISLEDGQFGLDCAHSHTSVIFLAQHYDGGRILEDLYDTKIDALNPEAGINFKNIVYEGSGPLWREALHNPFSMVNWIIVNQADPHDLVAQRLTPTFNTQFTRDIEEPNGLSLFHRNGLVFPTRPVPRFLLTQHTLCVDAGSTASRPYFND